MVLATLKTIMLRYPVKCWRCAYVPTFFGEHVDSSLAVKNTLRQFLLDRAFNQKCESGDRELSIGSGNRTQASKFKMTSLDSSKSDKYGLKDRHKADYLKKGKLDSKSEDMPDSKGKFKSGSKDNEKGDFKEEEKTGSKYKEKGSTKEKRKDSTKDKEKDDTKEKRKDSTKDKEKDGTKDKEKDGTKEKRKDSTKDKEKDGTKEEGKDGTKDKKNEVKYKKKDISKDQVKDDYKDVIKKKPTSKDKEMDDSGVNGKLKRKDRGKRKEQFENVKNEKPKRPKTKNSEIRDKHKVEKIGEDNQTKGLKEGKGQASKKSGGKSKDNIGRQLGERSLSTLVSTEKRRRRNDEKGNEDSTSYSRAESTRRKLKHARDSSVRVKRGTKSLSRKFGFRRKSSIERTTLKRNNKEFALRRRRVLEANRVKRDQLRLVTGSISFSDVIEKKMKEKKMQMKDEPYDEVGRMFDSRCSSAMTLVTPDENILLKEEDCADPIIALKLFSFDERFLSLERTSIIRERRGNGCFRNPCYVCNNRSRV